MILEILFIIALIVLVSLELVAVMVFLVAKTEIILTKSYTKGKRIK